MINFKVIERKNPSLARHAFKNKDDFNDTIVGLNPGQCVLVDYDGETPEDKERLYQLISSRAYSAGLNNGIKFFVSKQPDGVGVWIKRARI